MSKSKWIKLIILVIVFFFLWSSYIKWHVRYSIKQYLSERYGIKEDFTFISYNNNWLEGIDYQTMIELKNPYHSYLYFKTDRNSYEILQDQSDDMYLGIFAGAYMEQHPKVISFTKELIRKYGFIRYPNQYKPDDYFFPRDLIDINIDSKQQKNLEKEFRKNLIINTTTLLPKLKPNNPPTRIADDIGVINFTFTFDLSKTKHPVPKAEDIVTDFQKSRVLTTGIYNVKVHVFKSESFIGNDFDSIVSFRVDEKGTYTIISRPNSDDL
ncbi:hypothetical protein [Neobacillus vireti]|uniref:hypothetical protein n=1 Tax=Neobacillus vireti TaxID=220686 RepID=UPI00300078C5